MSSATLVRNLYPAENPLLIIERFLRDRNGVWQQIWLEHRLNNLLYQMLLSSAFSLACYGAVMGIFQGIEQALSSAVKLPIVFLLTLAICMPPLYLFNLLFGGRLSAPQTLALVLAAITVTSIFTLAFAPMTIFILVTARSYAFFVLVNIAILAVTSSVGLYFLVSGALTINRLARGQVTLDHDWADDEEADERTVHLRHPTPVHMMLLYLWLHLYALIGTQLSWTLRPFIGNPSSDFYLFRSTEGNFYNSVFYIVLQLLS